MTDATQLIELLSNPAIAQAPRSFPQDPRMAGRAGMYVWWADDAARVALGAPLGDVLPALVYAGQAGATRWPSGTTSNATLKSRIRQQHIGGNAGSSTFRLTISALLVDQLQLLVVGGGRLERESNNRVSTWIAEHMRVGIAGFDDRHQLGVVEAAVVTALDPPLNLEHCSPTKARSRLTALRSEFGR